MTFSRFFLYHLSPRGFLPPHTISDAHFEYYPIIAFSIGLFFYFLFFLFFFIFFFIFFFFLFFFWFSADCHLFRCLIFFRVLSLFSFLSAIQLFFCVWSGALERSARASHKSLKVVSCTKAPRSRPSSRCLHKESYSPWPRRRK